MGINIDKLNQILQEFVSTTSEIQGAALVTPDGLPLATTLPGKMDFGKLRFSPEFAMHLYGTPGQERFDFMWDLLIRKAHAYILLVGANQPKQFRSARRIMSFMNQRVQIPMLVGVTHTDCENAWQLDNIRIALGFASEKSPLLQPVHPLETTSVAQTLLTLAQQLYTPEATKV
ncbi:UNVERIFIED_CONTAM: hypothetical protein BEN50_16655 [Euhalothece sp. KZN 001]